MIDPFVFRTLAAVRIGQDQHRLDAQAGSSAAARLQQRQARRAVRPVADEAQALGLEAVGRERAAQLAQPLRPVDQAEAAARAQQPGRRGAELRQAAAALRAGRRARRIRRRRTALRGEDYF